VVVPLTVYGMVLSLSLFQVLSPGMAAVVGLILAAIAYVSIPLAIDMRVRGRRDKIVASLPTVLDLMTLSVEAGMSFDAALSRLVRRLDGPLIDELALMQREMQLGTPRSEALTALAHRVDAVEVTSFARALAQAEKLGVPLAQMLRTQADELRIRLRNNAEEHAMRAPVKMLFPTVALIFPAMFVVVLGPAVISILDNLARTH
jgi:tight adherence protein C